MHVVVCGAGTAGPALALPLHRQGADAPVVEAAPGPRTEGWVLDFFGPGHAAARMGLLPRLQELSRPVEELVRAGAPPWRPTCSWATTGCAPGCARPPSARSRCGCSGCTPRPSPSRIPPCTPPSAGGCG
ncbi:hypothetical protein AS188_11100 [Kocuria flava]|uniref:FAD-binding domain-containing protein n=1 Tax=Kocuria flava TaxID=446860 RepID=A0A0U3HXJ6_9MICC|nr:hypothetical protein [Kocuria flava]ALU40207.1 hypothetical protein AS188_11100 [Kocuria flava]GEO93333.1 hypothetical protein KFL01_26390 [Kocuria flava]